MTLDTTIDEGELGHILHHETLAGRFNNGEDILSDVFANRPDATTVEAGTLFWATDTNVLYRSDGATWSALAAGVTDHGALTGLGDDDHPQYLTEAEADALYEALGDIAAHAAAGDPHTGYRLESADHSHLSTGAQGGTVPGADTDAIHDNVAGEINAITGKTTPVGADLVLIEDSEASNAKKKLTLTNLMTLASGGGDTAYADAPNSATSIASTSDVTVFTTDLASVVAGDTIDVEVAMTILNNSGATRQYTITIDFDNAFDVEMVTAENMPASATNRKPLIFKSVCSISASNLANLLARMEEWVSVASGTDGVAVTTENSRMSWGTTSSDLTGTLTVNVKVRSDNAASTQTCHLHSVIIRKMNT
jgi:hypothetical protein